MNRLFASLLAVALVLAACGLGLPSARAAELPPPTAGDPPLPPPPPPPPPTL